MPMSLLMALPLLAASGSVIAPADFGPEPDAQHMAPAEIRANNARLARNHPNYIRCQAREETGSLAKQIRSCRTNQQWRRAFDQGNQNARDTYEAMTSKAADGQQ